MPRIEITTSISINVNAGKFRIANFEFRTEAHCARPAEAPAVRNLKFEI
jgi:hypothetical protein